MVTWTVEASKKDPTMMIAKANGYLSDYEQTLLQTLKAVKTTSQGYYHAYRMSQEDATFFQHVLAYIARNDQSSRSQNWVYVPGKGNVKTWSFTSNRAMMEDALAHE